MTSMTLDMPRRFPWSTLLSVGLHGAVVAGLLYTSVHKVIELPKTPEPITVTMVMPADLEPPKPEVVQPPAKPVVEPEPVAEPPKAAVVAIPKPEPKPKPKPKPKPVKKVEEKPKREPVSETRPLTPAITPAPRMQTPPAPAVKAAPVVSGPRVVSRTQPQYPARAYALQKEGAVRVRFDVDNSGNVSNITILSATPPNMFEREVKQAMKKWRYESGKPGSGLTVNIVFRINGGASMQ